MFKTLILAGAAALALASGAHAQASPSSAYAANVAAFAAGYNAPVAVAPPSIITYGPPPAASTTAATATARSGDVNLAQTYKAAAETAYAAPLTFSQGTCYVSASGGGQSTLLGLSLAVPIKDAGCDARATAQALYALGEREAALRYLAAHDKGVAQALAGR